MCQRMANEGEAERLLKHDDISTTLIVDILMEFKRLKLSGLDLPPSSLRKRRRSRESWEG